ncbi:hypothetical protein KBC31_04310 [Candidatus Saccharibacteria bacterium]|nr:hypothetical protein [Candidatus Saccharibacteria bacterium]
MNDDYPEIVPVITPFDMDSKTMLQVVDGDRLEAMTAVAADDKRFAVGVVADREGQKFIVDQSSPSELARVPLRMTLENSQSIVRITRRTVDGAIPNDLEDFWTRLEEMQSEQAK